MAIPLDYGPTGTEISTGSPVKLFTAPMAGPDNNGLAQQFMMSADGRFSYWRRPSPRRRLPSFANGGRRGPIRNADRPGVSSGDFVGSSEPSVERIRAGPIEVGGTHMERDGRCRRSLRTDCLGDRSCSN